MLNTPESFKKLNSLTQYPKIHTYHLRGDDGLLSEEHRHYNPDALIHISEKVDGENVRIVILPTGEYLIGSRTEWLTMSGDRVYNDKGGMVDVLRPVAESVLAKRDYVFGSTMISALYFEVYGSKLTPAWKNYGDGTPGYRLFDVAEFQTHMLDWDIEEIARWREENEDATVWDDASNLIWTAGFLDIPLTPRLDAIRAEELPSTIEDMRTFLERYERTSAATATGHIGNSEGIVVSTFSRRRQDMTKIKFKDYDKVLARRAEEQKKAEKAARQLAAMRDR